MWELREERPEITQSNCNIAKNWFHIGVKQTIIYGLKIAALLPHDLNLDIIIED